MLKYIIIIISIILDGILSNFLPFMVNDLSLFTPMFTLISIFIVFPLFHHKKKEYYISVFLTGIIYDLLYTNLLFFNACIFFIIAFVISLIYKNMDVNAWKLIIYIPIVIVFYEALNVLFIIMFNLVEVSFDKFIYKVSHSLILNIIYAELWYFAIKVIPKKYKKLSIN